MMIDTLNKMSIFFRQNNGEQGIRRRIRMSEVPPFVKLLFWKNWNALQGGGWLFLKVIFANILLQGQAYLHHTHLPALIIHNNTLCNGNYFSVHTNYLDISSIEHAKDVFKTKEASIVKKKLNQ